MLIADSLVCPEHLDAHYSYNSDGSDYLENKPFIADAVIGKF